MKRNRKHNMSGWLAAATLLLTTACADNADLLQGGSTSGTNVVTFTVQTNMQAGGTRGDEAASETASHISDGTKADVLIFAVYEKAEDENGKETWKVATEFGKGSQVDGFPATGSLPAGLNAIDFANQKAKIQLVVTTEKTYKVAFWAQSKDCQAYTIGDGLKVKVAYGDDEKKYANNDELRDAFCGVSDAFEVDTLEQKTVTQNGSTTIILRRPFAQVNVGTVGWDYESAAVLEPHVFYKESYITLTGLADEYDVLNEKATVSNSSEDEEKVVTATFKSSNLPAFINLNESDLKKSESTETIEDTETTETKNKIYEPFGKKEEYLKVKLYSTETNGTYSYKPYTKWDKKYLTMSAEDLSKVQTEEYKYLSMCYVLVPTTTDKDGKPTGTTLDSVTFGFTGYAYDKDEDTFSGEGEDFPVKNGKPAPFEVKNVPVQANYRTNILGNNFFLANEKLQVMIKKDYFGDYNDNAYDDGTLNGNWPHMADFGKGSATTDFDEFFSFTPTPISATNYAALTDVSFNGQPYTSGLDLSSGKDNEKVTVSFSTKQEVIVTIVQATEDENPGTIVLKADGTPVALGEPETPAKTDNSNKNIRTYTVKLPVSVPASVEDEENEDEEEDEEEKAPTYTISADDSSSKTVILRISVIARNSAKEEESTETN